MRKTFLALIVLFSLLAVGCTQSTNAPASPEPTAQLATPTPPAPTASISTPSVQPTTNNEPTTTPTVTPSPTPSTTVSPSSSSAQPIAPTIDVVWSKDDGTRVSDGSVPFALKLKDGRIRLYYCGAGGILSSISSDGLSFQKEGGVRFNSNLGGTCDPSVVALPDGRFRMYYKIAFGQGGPGQAVHKVYSAISSDGLSFQDEGLRIDSEETGDRGWASVPEAVLLEDGRVRIYYVSGDFEALGGSMSAVSIDGLVFEKEEGARAKALVDPAVLRLADGAFLMLAVSLPAPPGQPQNLPEGIYALPSKDGLFFGEAVPVLQEKGVYDPTVIQLDGDTFRIYYGKDTGTPQSPSVVTKSITGRKPA